MYLSYIEIVINRYYCTKIAYLKILSSYKQSFKVEIKALRRKIHLWEN